MVINYYGQILKGSVHQGSVDVNRDPRNANGFILEAYISKISLIIKLCKVNYIENSFPS